MKWQEQMNFSMACALLTLGALQSSIAGAQSTTQSYSGGALRNCIRLTTPSDPAAISSHLINNCDERLLVSYIPSNGAGAGIRHTTDVGPHSQSSVSRTDEAKGTLVCRYPDLVNANTGKCTPLGATSASQNDNQTSYSSPSSASSTYAAPQSSPQFSGSKKLPASAVRTPSAATPSAPTGIYTYRNPNASVSVPIDRSGSAQTGNTGGGQEAALAEYCARCKESVSECTQRWLQKQLKISYTCQNDTAYCESMFVTQCEAQHARGCNSDCN